MYTTPKKTQIACWVNWPVKQAFRQLAKRDKRSLAGELEYLIEKLVTDEGLMNNGEANAIFGDSNEQNDE